MLRISPPDPGNALKRAIEVINKAEATLGYTASEITLNVTWPPSVAIRFIKKQ
jgi:hypothetical protein